MNHRLNNALTSGSKLLNGWPCKAAFKSARLRALKRGIVFELNDEWARERFTGRCELSGVKFVGTNKIYYLSIDRINPRGGYTKDNCRFILYGLNMMRGNYANDSDIISIAKSIARKK